MIARIAFLVLSIEMFKFVLFANWEILIVKASFWACPRLVDILLTLLFTTA